MAQHRLVLTTPRLRLRPPEPTDAGPLTAILAEPDVARFWPGYDRARVEAELIADDSDDAAIFTIVDRSTSEVFGLLQCSEHPDAEYRHAGIDLFLATRWQGQRLGGEAIGAALSHLFGTLGHHRVVIDPAADNTRAIRAYERLGFRRVGLLRQYQRSPDGSFKDGLLMELLAADYRPAHPHAATATPAVTLRTATAADVPALLQMMVDFNLGESITWSPATGEAPLRHLLAHPELGVLSLVVADGKTVGYALISFGFDLEFGGRDAVLTELYLEPAARGRRLGGKVMELLVEMTRAHGAGALHLQVRADNTAAQRLYWTAGFTGTTRLLLSRDLLRQPTR